MTRFKVEITGEGLERAMTALNSVGIPTLGPGFTPAAEGASRVGRRMYAVVDASSAGTAKARVRDNLPEAGDYIVRSAVPVEPGAAG
jgi:hypothetical protein